MGAFFAEYRKKPGFAGIPPLRGHFVPLQSLAHEPGSGFAEWIAVRFAPPLN
jgi:hypothetical protein